MPDYDFNIETFSFREPPQIPQEWVTMIYKLHPVTAAVVWQVLSGIITPSTITLAKSSPDLGRYMLINIVANGNVDACEEITRIAREELDEILKALVPGYQSRQVMQ